MTFEVKICMFRFLLNYIIIQLLNNVSHNYLSVQYFHSFHGWVTTKTLQAGCGWQLTNIFLLAGLYEYHRRTVGNCNCDQSYYLIYDRSAIIRKFMRNQNLIIADCRLDLRSM